MEFLSLGCVEEVELGALIGEKGEEDRLVLRKGGKELVYQVGRGRGRSAVQGREGGRSAVQGRGG